MLDKRETLETLYNNYGRTVYGIVLKLTSNVDDAERIFCEVYKGIDLNQINDLTNSSICNFLVSRAIQLVRNENVESQFQVNPYDRISCLDNLYLKKCTAEELCILNQQSRMDLFKEVRRELQFASCKEEGLRYEK